ncbi:hypothetical protein F5887DRAFT_1277545 [Amanita rubescens]|nr:hypothetical protein F5887DRAFT_1277545 [Amanita rubescens]
MDLVNGGYVNHCHSDASAIRRDMIKKRETLKDIERAISQLVEKKGEIEKDLVRLGTAAYNRNLLPNEILGHVFIQVVQDQGLPVAFPMRKKIALPQLAISHVCSHWRKVALRTPELWSSTQLSYLMKYPNLDHVTWLHQRWLARAGTFPVSLSIDFDRSMESVEIASSLQKILLPFRVKKLHLSLTYPTFVDLATFSISESALSDFTEVSLDLTTVSSDETWSVENIHFISRLRSIKLFSGDENPLDDWLRRNLQSLPWSQLRSMEVDWIFLDNLGLLVDILRQIPTLQVLKLNIYPFHVDSLKALTMPSLLDFSLTLEVNEDLLGPEVNFDKILRSFTCPSLTKFELYGSPYWTTETVEILKRQYNLQRLREVEFRRAITVALPVSHLLRSAPMLHSFSIGRAAILDDDTIIGISNGTLARFLRRLEVHCTCDVEEVFGMVEARKKTVDALIDNGCSWREEITVLRNVVALGRWKDEYGERVRALKEAGISITLAGY